MRRRLYHFIALSLITSPVPEHVVTDVLHGRAEITASIAEKLEQVFGVPKHFWLNLEQNYQAFLRREAANRKAL